jgi:hypothetical protein
MFQRPATCSVQIYNFVSLSTIDTDLTVEKTTAPSKFSLSRSGASVSSPQVGEDAQGQDLLLERIYRRPKCPVLLSLPDQARRKTGSPWVFCEHLVLIGAMPPCPCGYYGDPVQECTCSNAMVSRARRIDDIADK